jgi:hypothetical protein
VTLISGQWSAISIPPPALFRPRRTPASCRKKLQQQPPLSKCVLHLGRVLRSTRRVEGRVGSPLPVRALCPLFAMHLPLPNPQSKINNQQSKIPIRPFVPPSFLSNNEYPIPLPPQT